MFGKEFQRKYALSEQGVRNVKQGTLWTVIVNLVVMGGMGILYLMMSRLIAALTQGSALPGLGTVLPLVLAFLLLSFFTHLQQYQATYGLVYREVKTVRISLAERLRRLPLGYFGKRDLADLTGTRLILSGQTDFMTLFLFLLVITRIYAPFDQALALIAEMFVSQVSADRLTEIVVVMVYHIASLRRCLGQRELMRWLDALGYSETPSLEGKLERLEKRFHRDSFPHEIGLFLGYPLEDVRGFIANQGRNSKYTGEWKVYGNLNDALRLFQSYKDSRRWVMEQAQQGKGLADILSAC